MGKITDYNENFLCCYKMDTNSNPVRFILARHTINPILTALFRMKYFLFFFSFIILIACQTDHKQSTETQSVPSQARYYIPEIEIPGLGIDHKYVAEVLYANNVNYNKVYSVENPTEIRDKIKRLSAMERNLTTAEDTMVVFSIHALRSTLYSRLAKNDATYFDRVEQDLLMAISLIEGKQKYKADLAFEKLALASMYFMRSDLEPAISLITRLIEDYTDVSIPNQPMYISRSALVTYFQMMSMQSARENSGKYLEEGVAYLEKISLQNTNELGIEADNLLFRYYNFMGEPNLAGEVARRLEARAK